MKKILKVLGIILLIVAILIAALVVKVIIDWKKQAADQHALIKRDEELIGERFSVPRSEKDPVSVNLYIPESADKIPVIFNIHGGAFIGGNADALDTQSSRISSEWNAAIVTVQYTLALDGITIEYAVEEIVDAVKYFMEYADEYNLDTDKFVIMGYSAGGYHALAATLAMHKENINIAAQVLCYPYLRDGLDIYNLLTDEQRASLAPALFILADNDPIGEGSTPYAEMLRTNGVPTEVKRYNGAIHGFLEENNPEYENLNNKPSKSPEQEAMARDAEAYIGDWLAKILQ